MVNWYDIFMLLATVIPASLAVIQLIVLYKNTKRKRNIKKNHSASETYEKDDTKTEQNIHTLSEPKVAPVIFIVFILLFMSIMNLYTRQEKARLEHVVYKYKKEMKNVEIAVEKLKIKYTELLIKDNSCGIE